MLSWERLGACGVGRCGRREGGATPVCLGGQGQPSQLPHSPVSCWGRRLWRHPNLSLPFAKLRGGTSHGAMCLRDPHTGHRKVARFQGLLASPRAFQSGWRERGRAWPTSHRHRSTSDPSRSGGGVREVAFGYLSRGTSLGKQGILAPICITQLHLGPMSRAAPQCPPTGSGARTLHPDPQARASVPVLSAGVSRDLACWPVPA